jgi:hypothetical protein
MKKEEIIVEFDGLATWSTDDEVKAFVLILKTENSIMVSGRVHLFDELEEGNLVKLFGYWHGDGEGEAFRVSFKVESLERIYSEKVQDVLGI